MNRTAFVGVALAALVAGCAVPGSADRQHGIMFELGASEFRDGDRIEIVSVRSSTGHFGIGAKLAVQVKYKLASRGEALLYLGTTTTEAHQASGQGEPQSVMVARGEGQIELTHTIPAAGYLHVTMYDKETGRPFGGSYFGSGQTLLAVKDWKYSR